MRLTKLENTSNESIEVKMKGGMSINLPPTCEMNNVDVENVKDLAGKIRIKGNLTEVTNSQGKTKLYD